MFEPTATSDHPGSGPDDLVRAAETIAAEHLRPGAAEVDQGSVRRADLDRLGAAGLLGLAAAAPGRPGPAPAPTVRRVSEILAGADLSTWFVQAQHHYLVRRLHEAAVAGNTGQGPERGRLLADASCGRTLAGIAFSHLRHWPRTPVTVRRVGQELRFTGRVPWYTGWGLNDIALLAGVDGDDAVFALVRPRPGPGLTAGERLRLAALTATSTVTWTLDELTVPAADEVLRQPIEQWLAQDDLVTANVNPAVLGVTEASIGELTWSGRERGEPAGTAAAERLGLRWRALRAEAYRLIDEVPPDTARAERLALRAEAHELMTQAGAAAVIAGSGGAMAAGARAQRLAREGLFLLVQAQTKAARTGALERLG
jgi:hypothetical protein